MRKLLLLALLLPNICFGAALFDGTGDGYTVNNPNKGNTTTHTVCAWVKAASLATDIRTIAGYGQGKATSAGRGFDFTVTTAGAIRADNFDTATNFQGSSSAGDVVTGTWYHLCWVRNGIFTNKLFKDGTQIANPAFDPASVQNSTDDFFVGLKLPNMDAGWADWNGDVTHVAYWDEALSDGQIASLADKSTCPTAITPAPEIFLRMNALPATDSSANGFSVTESGTPSLSSDPSGLPCGTPPPSGTASPRKGQACSSLAKGQCLQ